jgi:hypothetical protein
MNAFRVAALLCVCVYGSMLAQQTNDTGPETLTTNGASYTRWLFRPETHGPETLTINGVTYSNVYSHLFVFQPIPQVLTIDGVTYSNVTWGTVTPATVSIMHASGTATIPLEKLPAVLQKRFGYDPDRAKQYRNGEAELERQQLRQSALRKLRAQNLRKVGNKLYDFRGIEPLLSEEQQWTGSGLDAFYEHLDQVDAVNEALDRNAASCVLGTVSGVQGDLLVVKDKRFGDYVYVMNYPLARNALEGQGISAGALWVGNRNGKRLYDCGTIPTDDDLLSLPVERVELK